MPRGMTQRPVAVPGPSMSCSQAAKTRMTAAFEFTVLTMLLSAQTRTAGGRETRRASSVCGCGCECGCSHLLQ